jgi:hypothetical protein
MNEPVEILSLLSSPASNRQLSLSPAMAANPGRSSPGAGCVKNMAGICLTRRRPGASGVLRFTAAGSMPPWSKAASSVLIWAVLSNGQVLATLPGTTAWQQILPEVKGVLAVTARLGAW